MVSPPDFPHGAAWRFFHQGTVMAVQTKTRDEREKELKQLAKAPGGRWMILDIYRDALKLKPGDTGPAGAPMIQVILEIEYPGS